MADGTGIVPAADNEHSPYIPKPGAEQVSERNRQIYAAFNGRNYMQLAREFDLTERHVRDIVEACRAADVANRQKNLF